MERDAIDFGTEKVSTLFKKLFFPTLLGMLGMSAMTAIDGIFIGHSVGSDGIAAVNIICPPLMLLTGLGLMTGTGCSVVASIHLSRGKTKAARLNVTQAFLFATAAAAMPVALLLAFTDEAARLLGSSEHLLPLVRDYIVWNVPSWVFMVWEAVALFVIRLDARPRWPWRAASRRRPSTWCSTGCSCFRWDGASWERPSPRQSQPPRAA